MSHKGTSKVRKCVQKITVGASNPSTEWNTGLIYGAKEFS